MLSNLNIAILQVDAATFFNVKYKNAIALYFLCSVMTCRIKKNTATLSRVASSGIWNWQLNLIILLYLLH